MSDKIFFHVDTDNISDNRFILNDSESHHFINVLRKSVGSEIWLTDGIGTVYQAIAEEIKNHILRGRIINKHPNYGENKYKIHLGVGILKRDKMEFVVEKATECGVNTIIPIIMDRSIKRDVNIERLKKIVLSATKQCGRSVIPMIDTPTKFGEYLDQNSYQILAFHENGDRIDDGISESIKKYDELFILVGPEGDFSEQEFNRLKNSDTFILNLGRRRLRSETAAISALSQINLIFN